VLGSVHPIQSTWLTFPRVGDVDFGHLTKVVSAYKLVFNKVELYTVKYSRVKGCRFMGLDTCAHLC
jgi:hypothetical protein